MTRSGFTIESASSSSQSDLEPNFGARQENTDSHSDSEAESWDQNSYSDSFVVLMSDSFEVISLPAEMIQVLQAFIRGALRGIYVKEILGKSEKETLNFVWKRGGKKREES